MSWESTATPADVGLWIDARGVAVWTVDVKSDGASRDAVENGRRGTPTESGRDGRAR